MPLDSLDIAFVICLLVGGGLLLSALRCGENSMDPTASSARN